MPHRPVHRRQRQPRRSVFDPLLVGCLARPGASLAELDEAAGALLRAGLPTTVLERLLGRHGVAGKNIEKLLRAGHAVQGGNDRTSSAWKEAARAALKLAVMYRAPAVLAVLLRRFRQARFSPAAWTFSLSANASPVSALYGVLYALMQMPRTALLERRQACRVASLLLDHGADPNQIPQTLNVSLAAGSSFLHLFAQQKEAQIVQLMVERGGSLTQTNMLGDTALHLAASAASPETCRVLLALGARPNARDKEGRTPLYRACAANTEQASDVVACAALLISAGAAVNLGNRKGSAPLQVAVVKENITLVRVLLAHSAQFKGVMMSMLEIPDQPLLSFVIFRGLPEIAQALLRAGATFEPGCAEVHLQDAVKANDAKMVRVLANDGRALRDESIAVRLSYTRVAADLGHEGALKALLEAGFPVNAAAGTTGPLHMALSRGNLGCVSVLLAHGADPNAPNGRSVTPLCTAAATGNVGCIRELVKHGASVDGKTPDRGATALHVAAAAAHADPCRALLQLGAPVDAKNFSGRTPLAALCGADPASSAELDASPAVVSLLLDAGADVNSTSALDECGNVTPLHLAAGQGKAEVVRMLLKRGAHLNADSSDDLETNHRPLCLAVRDNHVVVAAMLLDAGATFPEDMLFIRMLWTIRHGDAAIAMFCMLAKRGGLSDATTVEDKQDYVDLAADFGSVQTLRLLLDAGCPVHRVPGRPLGPLHLAVEHGHASCVRLLLEGGASATELTDDGRTALQIALACQPVNSEIVGLLRAATVG